MAAATDNEILLDRFAPKTPYEIAIDVRFSGSALNIEEHVVRKRRDDLKALVRQAQALIRFVQLFFVVHLTRDVHERDVEP